VLEKRFQRYAISGGQSLKAFLKIGSQVQTHGDAP
jgi:hypothetical protein